MGIRVITGSVYIAVLALFFALKAFVNDIFFDVLTYFFAIVGTFEMVRACKDKLTKPQRVLTYIFSAVCVPCCAFFESDLVLKGGQGALATAVCFTVFFILVLCTFVTDHENATVETVGTTCLCGVYPNLFLSLLVLCGHLTPTGKMADFAWNGNLAILCVFVISPFADSIAYVFGRFLKKYFPKKMAPAVSPNKTVIGGIGGLLGGVVGAIILYFIYNAIVGVAFNTVTFLFMVGLGLVVSVATEFGDLVESSIKRKVGIKDMGNLLPGHGGILDRIDGSQFATVVVYFVFIIAYLLA